MKTALLLIALSFPAAGGEPVRSYTGTVVVEQSEASDAPAIIVIDEEVNGVRDGIADVVYLFYVEPRWNGSTMAMQRAHIEDRAGRQLVITGGSRRVVFSLGDVPITGAAEGDLVYANGFGLARYSGEPVTRIRIDSRTMALTHVCDHGAGAAWCPE